MVEAPEWADLLAILIMAALTAYIAFRLTATRAALFTVALLAVYGTSVANEAVQILDHECFMQTERRSLGDGRYIVLSGRMDRVARRQDGTIEVLDVKTGNSELGYTEKIINMIIGII